MVVGATTMWAMPAALELCDDQKVPLQVFVGTCSGTPRTLSRMCPGKEAKVHISFATLEKAFLMGPSHSSTRHIAARATVKVRTDGECACASAVYLEGSRTLCPVNSFNLGIPNAATPLLHISKRCISYNALQDQAFRKFISSARSRGTSAECLSLVTSD